MRRASLVFCTLIAACNSDERCSGPTFDLELTFFAPEFVQSLLITYEGDGTFEREIHAVEGTREIEVVARAAPVGENVTVTIGAYERPDVRGRLLGEGKLGPMVIGACDRLELELTDRFVLRDAGVPDAGAELDASSEPDASEVPDTGEPNDAGPPECASKPDDDTLALFPFDGAETTGTTVTDVVSGITGAVRPAQGSVATTPGADACGDSAAFFGAGYVEIPGEGLAPSLGSVDFYVRFDGAAPTARQGVITRDANGQTLPGHLAFFRTCDEHLVVRFQDTMRSVWRCSDRPLVPGRWTHVSLDFGEPGLALAIDGQVATSTGTRFASGDCIGTVACDGEGVFEPSGNQNPWVLGADSSGAVEGTAEPVRAHFFGAIDQFRVSRIRRN
jgi:hypothetical protein